MGINTIYQHLLPALNLWTQIDPNKYYELLFESLVV